MRAILTSVEYGDILALTLPYNRHHFDDVMVVTTPDDEETQAVAKANNCQLHITADFYSNSAQFNKWTPLEQGLDKLGRRGWICIMDADVAWPKELPPMALTRGKLYSPRRYIHLPPSLPPEETWAQLPVHNVSNIWAGYTQIFHSLDPHLPRPPWHKPHKNAGGPDTVFQNNWPAHLKERLPFKVLHIGPTETNWGGRVSQRVDGSLPVGYEYRQTQVAAILKNHHETFRSHL